MFFMIITLLAIALLQPITATFSDFEGSVIPVQKDTLSWSQIGAIKTVFLLLVLMWLNGVLPMKIEIPLHHLVRRHSNDWPQNLLSEVLIQIEAYEECLKVLQRKVPRIIPNRKKAHNKRFHNEGRTQVINRV
ncbi:uncharacterized protein [Anabrus simplex]|uniref:uncharacterized protein n=1 Tax=Anabrus simplex TaxID=316456 RepID=UPI0035A30693